MKNSRVISIAAAFAWFVLIFFYFFNGNTEQAGLRQALSGVIRERLSEAVVTVFILTLASLAGLRLLRLLKIEFSSFLEKLLFGSGLGLGCLSYAMLGLGLLGILDGWVWLALGILIMVLLHSEILKVWYGIRDGIKNIRGEKLGLFEITLILIFLGILGINFIGALTPELSYDSLEYHLGSLSSYLKAGRIHFIQQNVYANFPANIEMLYLWGIILNGDTVSRLLNLILGLWTALAVFQMGRKFFSFRSGVVSAALFYITGQITIVSVQSYVELGLAFFSLLAVWSVINYFSAGDRRWLLFSGVYCGLAAGCKYTGLLLVLLPVLILIFIFFCWKRKNPVSSTALVLVTALLIASPWFVKNLCYTGNPVYPLFQQVFRNKGWDEARYHRFTEAHIAKDRSLIAMVKKPWQTVMKDMYGTPLFLLLLPLGLCMRKPSATVIFLILFALLFYLGWFYGTHQVERFFIPVLPVLALLSAWSLESIRDFKPGYRFLCFTVSAVMFFNTVLSFSIVSSLEPMGVACGFQTRDEFLDKHYPAYPLLRFMNGNLTESDLVLFLGDAQVYYADVPVSASTVFDRGLLEEIVPSAESAGDVRDRLVRAGVTHIYINHAEINRLNRYYGYLNDFNWRLFEDFRKDYLTEIYSISDKGLYLYRIEQGLSQRGTHPEDGSGRTE